ncbi:DNA-binding transcriptional regulator, XRE-family HTH domain [Sphingomonas laterariae]|uniref:DNA-binding transcriptional regulator, XRE-family HTH domain n=1 Tax=Edaphosphingomonas laterariae TaxID=861865 RepID=A0A239I8I5_9SPHN|nr:helix-turn-helix transcriptional regulator [Sphingomonas laterariae]SNS89945.1 DNA-binding transcriptional regulator, XRE-family HTH domain [Sphingomonas laterariae]
MGSVLDKIGANIRRLREARGLTQAELAKAIDANRNTISRIECGQQNVSILILVDISKALRVSLGAILQDCL